MGSNPSWHPKGDNYPVENVSWIDIQEFMIRLNIAAGNKNYRLPTEAEWEYAARGGQKSKGYIYSGSNRLDDVGWYHDNHGDDTQPVGKKQPNELGIYDMTGNVLEWCSDWFDAYYYSYSPQNNPTGPTSGSSRVLRGGSICYADVFCVVTCRYSYAPNFRFIDTGFRLVLP